MTLVANKYWIASYKTTIDDTILWFAQFSSLTPLNEQSFF